MRSTRAAIIFSFVLVAAGGFAACGGSTDSSLGPQDLAGSWSGTTSQAKSILFAVSSEGVTAATFSYVMSGRCTFSATLPIPTSTALSISNGKFTTGKTQIGTGVFLTASGEFTSATAATGTLLIQDAPCADTLSLTWTATKQP